jgi:phosphoglycerate dehydrogenase-like enzyme
MSFKIGVTRDLMASDGGPCFPEAAFGELEGREGIAWEWLPENVPEITAEIAARYDGLYCNLPRVTAASLGRDDCRLKIIARNGVGYDTVDLDAATDKGIVVTNTPIAVRRPVAVATLTLLFALAGRLFEKDRMVRENRWNDRVNAMGFGLTSRTLGLVGAGSIGKEIMRLAAPFFREIIATDPFADAREVSEAGGRLVDFEEVMRTSDFVVVCCLLSDQTLHLIDADAFDMMKPEAFFLNVGRGPIHDEAALIAALQSGSIAGAGLDVTEMEPIQPDNPLLKMENTIVTPHALCWTDECFESIARTALRSIVDVAEGRRPRHVVNPEAAVGLK